MTQLELFDAYPQRGLSRFAVVRSIRWMLASLQVRAALSRIARPRKLDRLDSIPAHLRRDLGLPEVYDAPSGDPINLLTYWRLK